MIILENKTFLFSYFKSKKYISRLVDSEIKDRLSKCSDTKNDGYHLLISTLDKVNFEKSLFLYIEKFIIQTNPLSQSKTKISNLLKIILQTNEDDISLRNAYDYIYSSNIQEQIHLFNFFIIQILYHRPNLFKKLENDERLILKKIICKEFNDSGNYSDRDDYYLIIGKVEDYFNKKWDYLNRQMLRYNKINNFIDFKKNRENLFVFLKNLKTPFISFYDIHQTDRIISNLNLIINEHPNKDDLSYNDYYNRTTTQLKELIYEFERDITFYSSITFLPILQLVLSILENENSLITESMSSDIFFSKPDKKYPLNAKEYFEIDIPLYYHSGNSQAREVYIDISSENEVFLVEPINQYCDYLYNVYPHREFISKFKLKPIKEIENESELDVLISWKSIFGKNYKKNGKIILKNIDSNIDWKTLRETENPYSLNAKENLDALIGRNSIITQIKRGLKGSQSYKIYGQRRVGKTSIGKSLYNFLKSAQNPTYISFIPAYLSLGEIATSSDILKDIGYFIAEELFENFRLKRGHNPLNNILNEADFESSLTKLLLFLKKIFKSYPDIRIVIFIDEFDELHQHLYKGEQGNNFFLTLKSITELNNISIIIIGGEKLPIIFAYQGIRFNKIDDIAVDYFDIQKSKEDLKDLILYPSLDTDIDFSETAISAIIEYSAGNPYYIMLLCKHCFDEILRKEMYSVDRVDIEKMIKNQIETISIQHFQHYWEDGKIGSEEEVAWWAFYNSKILILLSQMSQQSENARYTHLIKSVQHDKIMEESELLMYLEQLVRRRILIKFNDDEYKIRVRLLEEWLRIKGSEEINLLFKNTHYLSDAIESSKKYKYTQDNIRHLEKKFEKYYQTISKDDIRIFLNQFNILFGSKESWYAYKILENVKLYSRTDVEKHFKELFKDSILKDVKEIHDVREGTRQKFDDIKDGSILIKSEKYQNIIVSRIDEEGKSGSEMLRVFAMANNILARNCLSSNDLKTYIKKDPNQSHIIIFIDDFIGTGDSAVSNFDRFFKEFPENYFSKHFLYYCVICAYNDGIKKLESQLGNKFRKIVSYEYLGEKDKAFSESNNIFHNSHDRFEAMKTFSIIGEMLEKKYPLGYKNMQSLVVFWDNTPNDTLPLLRKGGKVRLDNEIEITNWQPLFHRR